MFEYDPARKIDTSVPPPEKREGRFGWFGPYPSRPCDYCANETFTSWDWNMGYRCTNCNQAFGTPEEWKY